MKLKRFILLALLFFVIGGCASGGLMSVGNIANVLGGEQAARSKNPLIEAEVDLVLVDQLSAIVKFNQIMLERMPISYEDQWPELLNDYYAKTTSKEASSKSNYNRCLYKLLKKDFSFYRLYNVDAYMNYLIRKSILGAIGSKAFIEGCKVLGIEYEHVKNVLSYVPFGCRCGYFRKGFIEASPNSKICKNIRGYSVYKKCDFFNRPTEVLLTKYLFQRGGLKHWADLPVPIECFRAVKGEHLGTFKEVFYSLLDLSVRSQIQRIDDELMADKAELESIKAQLKDTRLSPAQRAALNKKKNVLYKRVKNKEMLQKKLYKQALMQLNVTYENVKKAKKLKEIVDYIDRSFRETLGVMVNLTVKLINDIQVISKTNMAMAFATYPFLVNQGVFYGKDRVFYQNRYKLVVKKLVSLPVTYFQILGYAIAQEYQTSKYRDYLKALIKMEKKIIKK